jgi:hypothetical protein
VIVDTVAIAAIKNRRIRHPPLIEWLENTTAVPRRMTRCADCAKFYGLWQFEHAANLLHGIQNPAMSAIVGKRPRPGSIDGAIAVTLDVRFGSLADKPSRAKIQVCPLLFGSEQT